MRELGGEEVQRCKARGRELPSEGGILPVVHGGTTLPYALMDALSPGTPAIGVETSIYLLVRLLDPSVCTTREGETEASNRAPREVKFPVPEELQSE